MAATCFLPFAAGYFLSYVYRSVNAVIGPNLVADLRLDAAGLGLLTSAYFLAFAASSCRLEYCLIGSGLGASKLFSYFAPPPGRRCSASRRASTNSHWDAR